MRLTLRAKALSRLASPLLLAALVPLVACGNGGAPAFSSDFTVTEVADGVFVHQGVPEDANPQNGNDLANIGFIVGAECAAVIDTGGTPAVGRQLKAALARVADVPACYVINTHMHPDHVLGNSAFAGDATTFIAHENLARALAVRADTYLQRLARLLAVEPTPEWIVLPERKVADRVTLDLGGREIVLQAWPTAHSNNDLTVFDPASGTLWTGDLVFVNRIPALDGSLKGWLAVLEELTARPNVQTIVPGHGPPEAPWPAAAEDLREYLKVLLRGVRAAIDAGRTIEYAIAHVGYEQAEDWLLFEAYHRRNVTAAFAELEWE